MPTVWLQMALPPQELVACQVRVIVAGQGPPLVTVLRTVIVMLGSLQHGSAAAVGGSKSQTLPQSTVLSLAQFRARQELRETTMLSMIAKSLVSPRELKTSL